MNALWLIALGGCVMIGSTITGVVGAQDAESKQPATSIEFYVEPTFFVGTLYLSTTSELSQRQSDFLSSEIEKAREPGQLIALASADKIAESKIVTDLKSLKWSTEPIVNDLNKLDTKLLERLDTLHSGSCIWLRDSQLDRLTAEQQQSLGQSLASCLARRVVVIVDCSPEQESPARSRIGASSLNLLPDFELVRRSDEQPQTDEQSAAPSDKKLQLRLGQDAWVRVCQRQLANLSEPDTSTCELTWPATSTYTQELHEAIEARTIFDLTAGRRALYERRLPIFPSETRLVPRLEKGSLVIVGGGGDTKEIWQKFIELAGGSEAKIVVLPTAMPQPELEEADEAELLKRLGAKEVRVLPQHTREDVSTDEYSANLRWATGVWFGGGRQWRFVDAYFGTPAWHELQQVVARGGVIGGSSAGATIQGDLLVRGHPLGNQIMVADGYRRGLGLLPGVAIDQHFKQRNRFDELASVLTRFPSVYGIGIDESTALVVESPNRCSVLGKGNVWLNPPNEKSEQRTYTKHPSGSQFELR